MRHALTIWTALLCAGWLTACTSVAPLPPAEDGPRRHTVMVVSNGWHTAIIVPRAALDATGLLPEAEDFPAAAFLEFGWGDRIYFPAARKTLGMTFDAAMTPTPAIMHVAGRAQAPVSSTADGPGVPVALSEAGFRRLAQAITEEFQRSDGARAKAVSPGLYRDSLFYDAQGEFHLFNTCNTWTARMLRAAGVDVSPSGVVTADDMMTRLEAALASRRPAKTGG